MVEEEFADGDVERVRLGGGRRARRRRRGVVGWVVEDLGGRLGGHGRGRSRRTRAGTGRRGRRRRRGLGRRGGRGARGLAAGGGLLLAAEGLLDAGELVAVKESVSTKQYQSDRDKIDDVIARAKALSVVSCESEV